MKIFNVLFLFVIFSFGSLKVQAQLNPANNDPMPKGTVVGLADLCAFQYNPVFADGSSSFGVKAGLYNTILNLVGTSQEAHDKIWSEEIANKIAPFITPSQDAQGNYHYTIVPGTEEVVLGYAKSLDATKFRDLLDSTPTQDDSNQDNPVWVYLNSINNPLQTENRPSSGYLSQNPINGLLYDFYRTQNDSSSDGNQNFSQECWVGMKEDGSPIEASTVRGNIQNTSSDAAPYLNVQDVPTPGKESNGIEASASSTNGENSGSPQDTEYTVFFKRLVLAFVLIAAACVFGPVGGFDVGAALGAGPAAELGNFLGGPVAVVVAIKVSLSVPIKS